MNKGKHWIMYAIYIEVPHIEVRRSNATIKEKLLLFT